MVNDILKVKFPDNSFIEVIAHDVLDHVAYADLKGLLRKIRRWLKPIGILNIHLPNLDILIKTLHVSSNQKLRHEALRWLYGNDGSSTSSYWSNIIRWCYSPKMFTNILKDIGFEVISCTGNCGGFAFTVIAKRSER